MDLINYQDLESLFISDPEGAIAVSEEIICQNSKFDCFENFYSYQKEHSHEFTCQKEWHDPKISIHCYDCALNTNSCICLECFLNGNHQGHNYSIEPNSTGYCDCGNATLWKPAGFCHNHQGQHNDHPENYLDEKLRNVLTDFIFKAAFSAAFKTTDEQCVDTIFNFIFSFLQLGDGFRRLISISLTEKVGIDSIFTDFSQYTATFISLFSELSGYLINDQIFNQNYSKTVFSVLLDFMKMKDGSENYNTLDSSLFYVLSPNCIKYNILQNNWNWVDFMVKIFDQLKQNLSLPQYKNYPSFVSDLVINITSASLIQPNEQTQLFFDRLISEILNCGTKSSPNNDMIISTSFCDYPENVHFKVMTKFYDCLKDVSNSFKFKKNLKIDTLFEELNKSTDISPIFKLNSTANDKYILKYIKDDFGNCENYPSYYFESFHNGASFFFSMPLYEYFVILSGLENIFRIKLARLLLKEEYQPLRVKLGIITVKKILSFLCMNQSLTPKNNFELVEMIYQFVNNPRHATDSISRYLPPLQLLIGLECNCEDDEFSLKDFFAFEIAKEIGIFDDFQSDSYKDEDTDAIQSTMTFSFLYFSLFLVVERILFNFDSNRFIQEQLISAFKQGIYNLNNLSKSYDTDALDETNNPMNFNTVLSSISAIKNSSNSQMNNHDISLSLKDGIKFNTISAVNPINIQKMILHKEITKNQDKLIQVQEFEDEDSYFFNAPLFSISSLTIKLYKCDNIELDNSIPEHDDLKIKLKEFLMTPTVLALVYHSLATSQNNDLNTHLALNILILISKFVSKESDNNKDKLFDNVTIDYESIDDLITKFRNIVFEYKTDEKGNSSIHNTINNVHSFVSLLNVKISNKSFIDVILSKGEIGKQALEMMSLKHEVNESVNNNEKAMKKKRANKLKEEIMNKFKNMISDYNTNESNNNEQSYDLSSAKSDSISLDKSDEVCSVCMNVKKDEILTYPICIYRTKFPFIVDKPPLSEAREGEESVTSGAVQNRFTAGLNTVIQFTLCNHPVHSSCIGTVPYQCPIDRTNKNGFLPSLENSSLDPSCEKVKSAVELFVNLIKMQFERVDVFVELVKSLAGLIATYEVRLRSLPGCLDSINNKILARNLFLSTWLSYRINNKPEMRDIKPYNDSDDENVDSRLTLFQHFIKKLIECDDLQSSTFTRLVAEFIERIKNDSERDEKEKLLFLRRVCLANHFLLGNEVNDHVFNTNDTDLIEWDDILSIQSLSTMFNVKFNFLNEDFEFKPFVPSKLPKEFLHFALEPYNFHVEETSITHLYNLIDYDYLINNYDDLDDSEMKTKYEVMNNVRPSSDSPLALLYIGSHSSAVCVIYGRASFMLRPFYLDMFGSSDVGFMRMRPLYLNEERYERFIDEVLSGDFTKMQGH